VAGIEERIGLGPRYRYKVLLDLARPWIIAVSTISVVGHKGDRSFPEAAGPEYTECRPSHAGQLVLDAEAHRLAPVPVGIINGTTYRGGVQPPLEPFRVLAALRRLLEDPRAPGSDVLGNVGLPYSGLTRQRPSAGASPRRRLRRRLDALQEEAVRPRSAVNSRRSGRCTGKRVGA
jgi:hypothetical protein